MATRPTVRQHLRRRYGPDSAGRWPDRRCAVGRSYFGPRDYAGLLGRPGVPRRVLQRRRSEARYLRGSGPKKLGRPHQVLAIQVCRGLPTELDRLLNRRRSGNCAHDAMGRRPGITEKRKVSDEEMQLAFVAASGWIGAFAGSIAGCWLGAMLVPRGQTLGGLAKGAFMTAALGVLIGGWLGVSVGLLHPQYLTQGQAAILALIAGASAGIAAAIVMPHAGVSLSVAMAVCVSASRQCRSNSCTASAADWLRDAGSLACSLLMMLSSQAGTCGCAVRNGVGAPLQTWTIRAGRLFD